MIPIPQPPYTDTMPISGTVSLQVGHAWDDAYVTLGSTVVLNNETHSIRMGGPPGVAGAYVQYVTGLLFRELPAPRCAHITSREVAAGYLVSVRHTGAGGVAGQISPAGRDLQHGESLADSGPRRPTARRGR